MKDVKNEFEKVIRDGLDAIYHSSEEYKAKIIDIDYAAMDFLESAIQSCNVKDEFELMYSPTHIFDVSAESKKTRTCFTFGFSPHYMSFFLSMDIENPLYLKNLQDRFLVDFFRTCNEYNIEYKSDHQETSGKSIFNKSIKSNIFRLLRNYTSDMLSEDGFKVYDNTRLGYFEKIWRYNSEGMNIDGIYNDICVLIKILYKFNYHLWKAKCNDEKNKGYQSTQNTDAPSDGR